jgi:hypothetical protein
VFVSIINREHGYQIIQLDHFITKRVKNIQPLTVREGEDMETKSRSMEMLTYFLTAEDTGPVPGKGRGQWVAGILPRGAGILKTLFWYLVSLGGAIVLAAL